MTVFLSEKNGAEVENQDGEFVCLDCNTVVDDETGHDNEECREAAFDRAESMEYDQSRD